MSDTRQDETQRLEMINRRVMGASGSGRAPRIVFGGLFALLFVGASIWALAPGQVRNLLGLGTSHAERMQQPDSAKAEISTAIPRQTATPPSDPIPTGIPRQTPEASGMATDDQARLAAMEAELRVLRDRQAGLGPEELRALLDANAAQMRSEMNRMLLSQNPVTAGINPDAQADARKRMEEERARRAAVEQAQVASRGLVIDGAAGSVPSGGSAGTNGSRSANESFLSSAASAAPETVRAQQLADTSRMIVQGTLLEGVLETAITTDLPGAIRAVLSQDVLSYDGSTILLPKGTRLIGTYNSEVKIAQRRALVAWNRAITPDGTSVALGGIGADALGRSGQTGVVDTHFWERFGSAALISMFGLAPQMIAGESTNGDMADAIEDLSDDLRTATSGALDAYLRIAPTINVAQGDRLTIFVNRDLIF